MARVHKGSHSFTCHRHVYLQLEWTIPAFTPHSSASPHWLAGTHFTRLSCQKNPWGWLKQSCCRTNPPSYQSDSNSKHWREPSGPRTFFACQLTAGLAIYKLCDVHLHMKCRSPDARATHDLIDGIYTVVQKNCILSIFWISQSTVNQFLQHDAIPARCMPWP